MYTPRKTKLKSLLILLTLFAFALATAAQADERIYSLKAAFIYNFTKYITWETDDNPNEADFIIGVVSSSPIIGSLQQIAANSTVKNKRLIIRVFDTPAEIRYCNILFIPAGTPFSLQSILTKTGPGTLTISEQRGFAEEGTAFNFVLFNNKLKFETNLKVLASAGLKASSQLLKLAIIVE